MTRDEARKLLPYITAFANGEAIQARGSAQEEWHSGDAFSFLPCDEYRIASKPKYIPYEHPSEVPLGEVIVRSGETRQILITAAECGANGIKYQDLTANWTFEKTGLPVGKLVQS